MYVYTKFKRKSTNNNLISKHQHSIKNDANEYKPELNKTRKKNENKQTQTLTNMSDVMYVKTIIERKTTTIIHLSFFVSGLDATVKFD